MKVKDITAALEAFAPLSLQEDWDNSGLSVGSPDQEVHGVLIGFDCTPELIDEAISLGDDMIVTHHPLIFGGIKAIHPEDPVGLAIIKAIKAGIAIYASHTPADKVQGGVSMLMARRLGLSEVKVLEPEGDGTVGFGAIGSWQQPLSAAEAVARVKEAFGLTAVRTSRFIDGPISRVAMCGGAGASMIGSAMAAGAQLYLCGDISYHHFFTPEGFMVMDIGHFEGEVEIVDALYSSITEKFTKFAVHTSTSLREYNPVHYL